MSRAPIIGGVPDTAHPAVVAIVERRATCASGENLQCSGTLISPRAVLTSAHCLEDLEPDELEVITGASIDAPGEIIAVWDALVHPAYQPGGPPQEQADLAVLVLASAPAVTPAAWSAAPPPELVTGAALTAVGYGATAGTPPSTSGARLAATATVDELLARALWTTGGTACSGDSGGALFATGTAGGELVVGVLKGSGPDCADRALAIRTDAASGFILDAIGVADASVAPERPPIADAADACAGACVAHADCPLGMLCLPDGEGSRCGWRDVRTVALGDTCNDAAADCISVGQGAERACRRALECPPPFAEAGGCCAATGAAGVEAPLAIALIFWAASSRRRASSRSRAPGRRAP